MSRELEAEALYYEGERSKNRTLGCFSGCATFIVPFLFSLFGSLTPLAMFVTFGLGIFFMIRGLSARAKRDEAYHQLGAIKTHSGYRMPVDPQSASSTGTPATGSAPVALPAVNGLPPRGGVDPWSLTTSSASGTTPGAAAATPSADSAQDGTFADDDKLAERLKKAKKTGF